MTTPIYRLGFRDHITDALTSLQWLQVPECVKYKVAVLTCKALYNTVSRYLGPLVRVADIPGRHALNSAVTDRVAVLSVHLHTVGNMAFPVAAPKIWNSLPDDIVIFCISLYLLPPTEDLFI